MLIDSRLPPRATTSSWPRIATGTPVTGLYRFQYFNSRHRSIPGEIESYTCRDTWDGEAKCQEVYLPTRKVCSIELRFCLTILLQRQHLQAVVRAPLDQEDTNNQNKCSTYCPGYSSRHILGIETPGQCCPIPKFHHLKILSGL